MRVSDNSMFISSNRHIAAAREALQNAQNRATSGLRVEKPSDDPAAAAAARRETARIARAEGTLRAVDASKLSLESADGALEGVGNLLVRARELAVQSSNGTLSPTDRAAAALEIAGIREQVIRLGNTEAAGSFVFAGYRDGTPPFTPAGAYVGDAAAKQIEIAPGVLATTGVSGAGVFGVSGGTDVLAVLDTLQTALETNDVATITASIDTMTAAHDQTTQARAGVGALLGTLEVASSAAERTRDRAITTRDQLVGADIMGALSDLVRAEQALEAAVQVAARLPPQGLLQGGR
jgi:flagellar hook-associated protein 3 FlgL